MSFENFVKDVFHYNPKTGQIFRKMKRQSKLFNSKNSEGYIYGNKIINGKRYPLWAHRIAWFLYYGYFPASNQEIDHINRLKDDNRISNLRLAANGENRVNSPKNKTNTSGYKGVSWKKQDNAYRATIGYKYKDIFIGHFKTAEEAAKAYDKKAKELFGEFAYLNFP